MNSLNSLPGVLHIGDERSWRGGENQILLFTRYSTQFRNFVAYPKSSEAVRLAKFNVPMLALPSKSPFDPRTILKLLRFIDLNHIQILAAQSSKAHSLCLMIKRLRPKLRLIVHRRVDNKPGKSFFGRRKYLSPLNDRFIAVSRLVEKSLVDSGVEASKIAVVYDGIVAEASSKNDREQSRLGLLKSIRAQCVDRQISDDVLIIGNASALNHQKGYEYLIEAMAESKRKGLNWVCAIAGTGAQEAQLKQLVSDLDLTDYVFFLGFVQPVRPFLESLDIMALTSRNEGLGSTLLDGALAGAALVGSAVGGIPEIILDRKTGLLTEPQNSADVFIKLNELAGDRDLRERFAAAAQTKVIQDFSIQKIVQQTEEIYRSTLI